MFPLETPAHDLRNRTRVEIVSSILGVAGKGALKTHIMYKANLSHRQLERYLAFLEENGLVEKTAGSDGTRMYQATEKGIMFLKDYSRISDYFEKKP